MHPIEEQRKRSNPEPQRNAEQPGEGGGRAFGNVIEPTQGQMASGNQGLTDDTDKPAGEKKLESAERKRPEAAAFWRAPASPATPALRHADAVR